MGRCPCVGQGCPGVLLQPWPRLHHGSLPGLCFLQPCPPMGQEEERCPEPAGCSQPLCLRPRAAEPSLVPCSNFVGYQQGSAAAELAEGRDGLRAPFLQPPSPQAPSFASGVMCSGRLDRVRLVKHGQSRSEQRGWEGAAGTGAQPGGSRGAGAQLGCARQQTPGSCVPAWALPAESRSWCGASRSFQKQECWQPVPHVVSLRWYPLYPSRDELGRRGCWCLASPSLHIHPRCLWARLGLFPGVGSWCKVRANQQESSPGVSVLLLQSWGTCWVPLGLHLPPRR